MKIIVTLIALATFGLLISQDYYQQDAVLHIAKDGSSIIEICGHFYDIEYIDHSDKCPCHGYVIDPANR